MGDMHDPADASPSPRGCQRTARGQCGSLLLRCSGLPPPAPCGCSSFPRPASDTPLPPSKREHRRLDTDIVQIQARAYDFASYIERPMSRRRCHFLNVLRAYDDCEYEGESMTSSSLFSPGIVTVSVDDGHPDDLKAAELLLDTNIKATFYVSANNPERPLMAQGDIMQISEHFELGAHTLNHRTLTGLDENALRDEIVDGKNWLEQVIGTQVVSFRNNFWSVSRALSSIGSAKVGRRTQLFAT